VRWPRASACVLLASGLILRPLDDAPAQPQLTAAAPHSSPDSIDDVIDRAFTLVELDAASSERLLRPILARADLISSQRARAERALGQALINQSRRDRAGDAFARALEAALAAGDRNEAGWARRWAGSVLYGNGQAADAKALWDLALEDFAAAGNQRGAFEVNDDLALNANGLDRRPYCERGFQIGRALQDPLLEARARARWAHGLLDAGLAGPALTEVERAVAVMHPFGRAADPYYGDALAILGWALRSHGAFDKAVPVHREAIRLAKARGDLDSQVWNYMGLGASLSELGRNAEAETAMAAGLRAAQRTKTPTTIRLLTESMGWIEFKSGRYQQAVDQLEAARAMPGLETTVTPLIHLAQAYRALHRFDESADRAAQAVALARQLGLIDNEIRASIEAAYTSVARGRIDEANNTLAPVVDRLETYRANLAPVDFLKQGFGERFGDAYGLMVHLLMQRGQTRDALTAAERARSRAFGDLLAARRAKEHDESGGDQWLLGESAASAAPEAPRSDSPRAVPALTADRLVQLAGRLSSTLVVYWTHETGSYVWVVGRDGSIDAASIPAGIGRLRQGVHQAVDVTPDVQLFQQSATPARPSAASREAYRTLYRLLWKPVASRIPDEPGVRLTIVPHGPLLAVPFAALIDERGRYLIERHALHYASSGAVLLDASDRTGRVRGPTARNLLVADPATNGPASAGQLAGLPDARREVQSIATLLPDESDVLVGRAASEATVRAALLGARVVHFATHALVTDADPLGSHLVLAAPTATHPEADNDGRLTASEVAGLSLDSDLVVLGSCRSARGKISSDGIAGLTRAFITAGTPSVVATLWDVNDRPTARLMKRFYQELAAGHPKDQALRTAQIALIRDLRAGRVTGTIGRSVVTYPELPWLWAAPILVGAP